MESHHRNVSRLSAALRHRILLEDEVVGDTLRNYEFHTVEKWLQKVCWRRYWKGWLEQRPDLSIVDPKRYFRSLFNETIRQSCACTGIGRTMRSTKWRGQTAPSAAFQCSEKVTSTSAPRVLARPSMLN